MKQEMKQRAGVTDRTDGTDVQVNDMINEQILSDALSNALGVSVITIKRGLYVLRDLRIMKCVGSNKTGHWEVIN